MPQHKSAMKRVRQGAVRRERNRVHRSRMRSMVKKLRSTESVDTATPLLNDIKAYLDRLAHKGIIHRNAAANKKSQLEKFVKNLA
ncbi:MAG: 30S ribosomal protein S20 [Bacteroidetes bacterium CG12_big_fil_rev_8_21_14_0_65_60_17]|nr:MAG: 30S ribosomal protein S20 [Bacteroidetes bacterium CG12_big_fil_rev_8_21_14_0_65_60_17]